MLPLALAAGACSTRTPPATVPSSVVWRQPAVPTDLASQPADVAAYEQAWGAIRSGDVRAGERTLNELLKRSSRFYPATTSLGEVRLQHQQYREAEVLFDQALAINPRYLAALVGVVDARLGAGDDPAALSALQALLVIDPSRADARARVEALGLRVAQTALAAAEQLRAAGQMGEAEARLRRALQAMPQNGAILRALAVVALGKGAGEAAEARAREAIGLDSEDAAALAVLGDALEAQGRFREAAASYARALAIDPNPSWRERRATLQGRADAMALPAGYQAIASATTVTRGQVAALLGVRLAALLDHAPSRSNEIVTDVRGHWAAAWMLPAVRAGWIDALPNHTFQPAAVVRRADLARIVAAVLADAAAGRARDLEHWRAARLTFVDLPRDHAAYSDASLVVSAGIMTVNANRFLPAGAVSGADLIATVGRLEALVR